MYLHFMYALLQGSSYCRANNTELWVYTHHHVHRISASVLYKCKIKKKKKKYYYMYRIRNLCIGKI